MSGSVGAGDSSEEIFTVESLGDEDAGSDAEAHARWVRNIVRPTFEHFARTVAIQGNGPIVSTSALACVIQVAYGGDEEPFEARIGLKALDSDDLELRIPGNSEPFGEQRWEQIDGEAVRSVLTESFSEWCRQRSSLR